MQFIAYLPFSLLLHLHLLFSMDMVFLCATCCHLGGWWCLFLGFTLLYDHVPIVAGLHVSVVEGDGVDFLRLSSILG